MRQSLKLGLPKLREQLGAHRVTNVDPLPDAILERIYSTTGNDAVTKKFIAAQSFDLDE